MKNLFEFPDGSSIEWVDKETLKYTEGDYVALAWVDYEPGFFSRGRIIRTSSIEKLRSCPDNEEQILTEEKRAEILNKVVAYYNKQKVSCRLEP